ncbi:hypothetical protein MMC21_003578 [Puttea exsequens]|nr:hypothetical protein [Puttea exsequens]
MIPLSPALPELSSKALSLYHTTDALLDNLPVLIFYGPSTTGNSTQNSSRIQAHVYSLAGLQSFPRLTVSPTSPLYAAVSHLPAECQGDEVSRGLAVGLLSYFAGLPRDLKTSLRDRASRTRPDGTVPVMFDEMHAGDLAAAMERIEGSEPIAMHVMAGLTRQVLSWASMDVILPPGYIHRATSAEDQEGAEMFDESGLPLYHYGPLSSIIDRFGVPAFLPTSNLQRAPSRPESYGRVKSLSKDQKINLRREMVELIDTESNYVEKLKDLVHCAAVEFRRAASPDSVQKLFPQSLSQILELNLAFFEEVQSILDETENEAIRDIEGVLSSNTDNGAPVTQGKKRDLTGATQVAKALVKWFPKFQCPYQDYLRASTDFPKVIGQALAENSSSTSTYLKNVSEQQLRSSLIEPVQRLPRYSLLIDNMIGLLPASHSALASLSKARDIITAICALDPSSLAAGYHWTKVLSDIVAEWPTICPIQGRLIVAVDVRILGPPYSRNSESIAGVLLLFPNAVLLLEKVSASALSARGILAEADHPTTRTNILLSSTLQLDKGLQFRKIFDLDSLKFSESEGGDLIRLSGFTSMTGPNPSTEVCYLLGSYDGKAPRFSEEIVKAMVEGKYPETIRDSGKWALRSINPCQESLGVYLALSEGYTELTSSPIRLYVNGPRDTKSILAHSPGVEVAVNVTTSDSESCRLETEGADGTFYTDTCNTENVAAVLVARLGNLVRLQNQPHDLRLIESRLLYHCTILGSLPLKDHSRIAAKSRAFHPLSPVKMISDFLSSQPNTPSKYRHQPSILKDVPPIPPSSPSKSRSEKSFLADGDSSQTQVNLVESNHQASKSPLTLLEDTFSTYAVALRSRSGNIVGKLLRGRASADELNVNELYNTLLEDPSRIQAAAEVSVDVLFSAFEKFLRRAWKDRMGPLLSEISLQSMQSAFDSGRPSVFAQQFQISLEEMSPQNKRAFAATVRVLSDLLDASANDGDRGALMASFAEALVLDGNPHAYITLLDRLVDDYDSLFEGVAVGIGDGNTTSASGSLSKHRSANTGSVNSTTSSLRKRFGFGALSRGNSKNESESKVASIWRTLSKNTKDPDERHSHSGSLSKASLVRSRSMDTDHRMLPPLRPVSRDRPPSSGATASEERISRPGSSHLNVSTLNSIGEGTPTKITNLPKRNRRSSLSDLASTKGSDDAAGWSPLQSRSINCYQTAGVVQTPPKTPVKQATSRDSPQSSGIPRRLGPPQKENSPFHEASMPKTSSPSAPSKVHSRANSKHNPDEVVISSFNAQKWRASRSGIPTPRGGLSERAWPPNVQNTPANTGQSTQKLRLQSPQKIRERLSQEQKTLAISDESFRTEMAKIGEEMATYKLQRSQSKHKPTTSSSHISASPATLESLSTKLNTLSSSLKAFTASQSNSISSIAADVASSLSVNKQKACKLDELYREANAENEVLYERFNDELGKILGKVKKGEGIEEMKDKLKEAQIEMSKLRKENARLKRELVGLRGMMKGV